jgi:hypothetical protein
MQKRTVALSLLVAATLSVPASAAVVLRLYNIDISWDPSGNLWYLTDKLCNMSDAVSQPLLYELQLYQGDIKAGAPIRIGAMKSATIEPHKCRVHKAQPFKVNTAKMLPGMYKIALWVGEFDGQTYVGDVKYVAEKPFVKSKDP